MRIEKPKNNRTIGADFEKKCNAYWKRIGAHICIPSMLAKPVFFGRTPFRYLDFFREEGYQEDGLDGLAYYKSGLFGWQAKRDYGSWSERRRAALAASLQQLSNRLRIPIYIMFEHEGQVTLEYLTPKEGLKCKR